MLTIILLSQKKYLKIDQSILMELDVKDQRKVGCYSHILLHQGSFISLFGFCVELLANIKSNFIAIIIKVKSRHFAITLSRKKLMFHQKKKSFFFN
jgi:hypothetical protein